MDMDIMTVPTAGTLLKQGAEAKIYKANFLGKPVIIKERFSKKYRHPVLDKNLTSQRTKSEVRSMIRCRINGYLILIAYKIHCLILHYLLGRSMIPSHCFIHDSVEIVEVTTFVFSGICTPAVYHVDLENHKIYMEHLEDSVTVRDFIMKAQNNKGTESTIELSSLAKVIGSTLAHMHSNNILHGDLTTSNMLLRTPVSIDQPSLVLIDFGLGYIANVAEDKGVDLYVLERAFLSTHPNTEKLFEVIMNSYKKTYGKGAQEILHKFEEVRMRGRKRTMIG